jgi:hypothetical protein
MRPDTEILRVRKQIVAVDLALSGIAPRQVEVFLAEREIPVHRRQRLFDLLEHGTSFLPARDSTTGTWEIVNRDLVVFARVALSAFTGEDGDASDELFDIRQRVRVDLTTGDAISGELLYSAAETLTRVTDYMNQRERFLRLWTEEDLLLIQKSFIARVIEQS